MIRDLFKPSCRMGYTRQDVTRLVGAANLLAFDKWMRGQTMAICDGYRWNPETRQNERTDCPEDGHGGIAYTWDVERFIAGGYPFD